MNILLQFFKALANEDRLQITGALAIRDHSVDELAALLNLKAPKIAHHLDKLNAFGLLAMRKEGEQIRYHLDVDSLHVLNEQVFSALAVEKDIDLVGETEYKTWEQKVLENFLDGDRITRIPSGYKKRLAVLKWLVNYFEEDSEYTEQEVNEIIARHHPDYATLRRAFIDNGLMKRERGVYWRIPWQIPDLVAEV